MAVIVAIIVLIGIAILKPWPGEIASPPDPHGTSPLATAAPVASAVPVASASPDLDRARVKSFCLEPSGWRLFETELWAGRVIRGWKSIQPIAGADGPGDARIPVVPQVSHGTLTLGFCTPIAGPDRPPGPTTTSIYRQVAAVPGTVDETWEAIAPPAVAPRDGTSALGGAWGPPLPRETDTGRPPGGTASWPSGLYVFHISGTSGNAGDTGRVVFERWFAVAVEVLPPVVR